MIDFEKLLNPEQLAAVKTTCDRVLILAGAGSGKTRTITFRVAWLLQNGVKPWQILLLTFTNKAANEMLTRVEELTGTSRGEIWGGTFHSIALRMLRKHGELVGLRDGFTILDADDAEKLFAKIVKKIAPDIFKKDQKRAVKPAVFHAALSFLRNTNVDYADVSARFFEWLGNAGAEILRQAHAAYSQEKSAQNVIDFDDILELAGTLLRDFSDVREYYQRKFKHILVDEFQDTNAVQATLIDLLSSPQNSLMVVGDDAQCIYTWRGASYENIVRFPTTRAGTEVFKIETNYRSTPEILDFANSILDARREQNFTKKLHAFRAGTDSKPLVVPALNAFDQGDFVAQKIKSLIEDEGVPANEIAVLYRAHNHSKETEICLRRADIPFVVTSGIQFFEQAHIRDFMAILRFLTNPSDLAAFTRITSLLEKIGAATAQKILKKAAAQAEKSHKHLFYELGTEAILKSVPAVSIDDFRDFIFSLQNMFEALTGTPIEQVRGNGGNVRGNAENAGGNVGGNNEIDLFELADLEAGLSDGNANFAGGNAKIEQNSAPANIVKLGLEGWFGDFVKRVYPNSRERCEDLDSLIGFAENFETLDDFLAQASLMDSANSKQEMRSRDDSARVPAVRLSTIHQAKGLEFSHVFVLWCSQGMFPSQRAIKEHFLDEERRLFYVACTRAKDDLTLISVLEPPRYSSGAELSLDRSSFIREADPATYRSLGYIVHFAKPFGLSAERTFYRDDFAGNEDFASGNADDGNGENPF